MVKIDVKKVLVNQNGENYKDGEQELTLGRVVGLVLATVKPQDGKISAMYDPLRSFLLANKMVSEDNVELDSEEIVYIKGIVKESNYFPYIIGQVFQLLEGKNESVKEKK